MLRLYLWPHRVLYLGPSPDNELHRHHAAQLCVSLDGRLTVWDAERKTPCRAAGILIPPDQPHRIDAEASQILALYFEPESDEYETLLGPIWDGSGKSPVSVALSNGSIEALRLLADGGGNGGVVWQTCALALGLGPSTSQAIELDPRVEMVIEEICSKPDRTIRVDELARKVNLSPGRLAHLFSQNIGIPIRRYIVWWRMRDVIGRALAGASLTDASHAAGFSDAAHMSNTFRQTFGFAPSSLFAKQVAKDVHILD